MKQEMSCPHSKTISTCPVCMIELNKITDKKSFVHSVEVAPGSYLVSPALINEIRKRTKDTEVLGGKRKGKRPPPLVPHIKGGIVIVRIPHGTPIDEATKATTWAHRLAAKINKSHEKDHYYEKGDWK